MDFEPEEFKNSLQSPLLQPSPTSLEQLQSHEALSQYAHETQEEENLFGALISNCILPKLKEFAPAYDPYDTEATKRVIALVDEVTYGVERTGDRFEVCLTESSYQQFWSANV